MRKISLKNALLVMLKSLGEASLAVIDEGFLNPRYSFTRPTRALLGLPIDHATHEGGYKIQYKKHSFSVALHRLKKEGFIARAGSNKYARWSLTLKGKKHIVALENEISKFQPSPRDGRPRIVCFDIPERERWKRSRLRLLLVASGYSMLQKSLWVGDRAINQAVFDEIKKFKISRYIHVFEISKRGTLHELDFE